MQSILVTLKPRAIVMLVAMVALFVAANPSHAQLRLDITQGVRDAVPIAVVPFGGQPEGGTSDIAAVVSNDLRMSGRFAPLERRDMVTRPTSGGEIRFDDWRLLKSDFIVVGRVEPDGAGLAVSFELHNVRTGASLLAQRLPSTEKGLRATAHRIADLVFERLTGIPGAFSTRIAYVAVDGKPPAQRYRLLVADADGYGPRTVLESREPIMSPAWSPDGQNLAYVSFEGKTSAVYVQRL
ncbi:MAG: Tol-Pal system protein TolB, partial [Steroidobacteraceae bacterium]|nr:Tol-Pal system protein TolB [Steroidobacteraceae bacterium]